MSSPRPQTKVVDIELDPVLHDASCRRDAASAQRKICSQLLGWSSFFFVPFLFFITMVILCVSSAHCCRLQ